MAYKARFVKKLKDLIGGEPVEYILTEVRNAFFLEKEAEKFAEELHPEAYGAFINSKIDYGEDAMELILSKWFERGEVFLLTKEKAVRGLIGALEKARKSEMAFKIKGMCSMDSQDTSHAREVIPVFPNNSHQVHQPLAPTKADNNQSIRKQVENRIGRSCLKILLDAIRNGDISYEEVRDFGLQMGGSVNGIYVAEIRQNIDLVHIFKDMMDQWFREQIFNTNLDAYDALLTILRRDIGLNSLVWEMEKAHQEAQTYDNCL